MEIKTEKLQSMTVFYFGKPENTTLSIIYSDPQIVFTCEVDKAPTNEFMVLWDNTMDINFYLNAEMEFVSQGISSGIKCLPHAEEFLKKQYMEAYNGLSRTNDANMKNLMMKSLANVKAALFLLNWYKENKSKYIK